MRKSIISKIPFKSPQSLLKSRNRSLLPAPNIKTMATKKLEDVVLKSMQIVQSQSYRQVTNGGEVIAFPSPTYDSMYAMVLSNATARPMIMKKRDEAFRNGINVEPNFVAKCIVCETEYDYMTDKCVETNCGGRTREPILDEKDKLKEILKLKNANGQLLKNVLKEISIDHDIVDDGWLISRNIYNEMNGTIIDFETIEFWRIHPGNAAFSMSKSGRIGEYEFTCIYHRNYVARDEFASCEDNENGFCGRNLHKVVAVRFREQHIEMRYIAQEVFHGSEYNPTAIYGFPPSITMWYNLLLTNAQEKYMAEYYVDKKWPSAAIFVPAKKRETAIKFKHSLHEQMDKDQQARPVFRFDPDAKHKPEVMRLTDTPQEMEYIPVREEARMRMAAFWGISPIFNADVQGSGGLNNESRQITVMSWATETKQQAMRENYLDKIVENLEVIDWHFEFVQLEEEDEASELQIDLLHIQKAQGMQALGFKVELDEKGKPTQFSVGEPMADPFEQMEMNDLFPSPPNMNTMGDNLAGQDSVLSQKSANHFNFTNEYGDWEWKKHYQFVKFEDGKLSQLNIHPDFAITQEAVDLGESRVRKETLDYYANEAKEMNPFVVDQNYNLLDGHHRVFAVEDKNQEDIRFAIVTQRENDDLDLKSFKEEKHPRDKLGQFTKKQEKNNVKPEKESFDYFKDIRDEIKQLPKSASQPLQENSFKSLMEIAKVGQDLSKVILQSIAKELNIEVANYSPDDINIEKKGQLLFIAPIKGKERINEKIKDDYNGNYSKITDAVRATFVVDSIDELTELIPHINKNLKLAQKPKNRFLNPTAEGYRDINLRYELKNGMVAELQINVKKMMEAKNKGHAYFEETRTMAPKRNTWTKEDKNKFDKLIEKQINLYGDAWDEIKKEKNLNNRMVLVN